MTEEEQESILSIIKARKSKDRFCGVGAESQLFAYAKTKMQISCAITAQLISVFVFATEIVQFNLSTY